MRRIYGQVCIVWCHSRRGQTNDEEKNAELHLAFHRGLDFAGDHNGGLRRSTRNVNDTPGRLSLWLDCIGCLVDSHRDVFSGGLDVWGGENTSPKDAEHQPGQPNYYPSFYNHFARCWLDGPPVRFYGDVRTDAAPRSPMLFGCRMTECMANQAHAARTGFAMQHSYGKCTGRGP